MQGDHFLVLSNDHVDLQSGNYGELQPRVAATPAPSIQKAVQNAKNVSTYYRWFVPFNCTGKMNCFDVRCEDTRSAALSKRSTARNPSKCCVCFSSVLKSYSRNACIMPGLSHHGSFIKQSYKEVAR